MEYLILLLALSAYILGTTSLSCFIAHWCGINLTKTGSGGAGATNLYRSLSHLPKFKRFSLTGIAFAWDVGKGLIAMLVAQHYLLTPNEQFVVGAAVLLGHTYPLIRKGGKAVATGLGVLLALQPGIALTCLAVFVLTFLPTGIVAIGSISAAATLVVASLVAMPTWQLRLAGVVLGGVIILLHRANIARILRDEETPLFHWRLGLRKFPENSRHCLFTTHIAGDGPVACKHAATFRFWWVRFLPANLIYKFIRHTPTWALYMGHSKGVYTADGQHIVCHVVGIPYEMSAFVDPKHPDYEDAYQRLLKDIRYFKRLIPEACAVGLGAGTGITHRNGLMVAKALQEEFPDFRVTNGNTFTAVAAEMTDDRLQATFAADRLRRGGPVCKAIVGAGGSVGSKLVPRILRHPDCSELLVVGNPNKENGGLTTLISTWQQLVPDKPIRIVLLQEALQTADTVFLCANVASGLEIDPSWCRKGLKIVDVGKPPNTLPSLTEVRPDILVVAGGHITAPGSGGYGFRRQLGLHGFIVYACTAETLLHTTGQTSMWRGADPKTYVGAASEQNAEELRRLAELMGFGVPQLFNPHTDRPIKLPG